MLLYTAAQMRRTAALSGFIVLLLGSLLVLSATARAESRRCSPDNRICLLLTSDYLVSGTMVEVQVPAEATEIKVSHAWPATVELVAAGPSGGSDTWRFEFRAGRFEERKPKPLKIEARGPDGITLATAAFENLRMLSEVTKLRFTLKRQGKWLVGRFTYTPRIGVSGMHILEVYNHDVIIAPNGKRTYPRVTAKRYLKGAPAGKTVRVTLRLLLARIYRRFQGTEFATTLMYVKLRNPRTLRRVNYGNDRSSVLHGPGWYKPPNLK